MNIISNDENIKNLKIRKVLRIVIIILSIVTIILSIASIFSYVNLIFPIISFIITHSLLKVRDKIKINKKDDLQYIRKKIDKNKK